MAKTCPHCQADLPSVGDAFCTECGRELDAQPESPVSIRDSQRKSLPPLTDARRYTFAGRCVIFVYAMLGCLGALGFVFYLFGSLPPGRYPLFYFVAPFLLLGVLLCANTFYMLEKAGIRIYEDPSAPTIDVPSKR